MGPYKRYKRNYLLDYDFDLSDGKAWKRTGNEGIPDCALKLAD